MARMVTGTSAVLSITFATRFVTLMNDNRHSMTRYRHAPHVLKRPMCEKLHNSITVMPHPVTIMPPELIEDRNTDSRCATRLRPVLIIKFGSLIQ
jgi:hypothetical protein